MTLQSSNLLAALQELPCGEPGQQRSFREIITDLVSMDRAMYASEFTSAVSFGMWQIFDADNVDDKLFAAFEALYTRISADQSLYEYSRQKLEGGADDWKSYITQFSGKVAEFDAKDLLESKGYSNVEIHPDPSNEGWDISAISPAGEYTQIQVKTGASDSQYYATVEGMRETDFQFALSTELYERISENVPELADRIVADIGSAHKLVENIEDGLNTLSDNMGIDVPDGIVDIIPYAAAIMAGARLLVGVLKTEKEFKAADRTTRNRIQVVQTLTVMSRMGITTVLATAGGMGGGAMGSAVPGVGNLIGGIVGSIGGAGIGMYLNRHLEPHMLDLALDITGLTNDDLFYYKNKPSIDTLALNFQSTAGELSATPA